MTVLRHQVLDGAGHPVAGVTATVWAYSSRNQIPSGTYRRQARASAVSDDYGWLYWTLPRPEVIPANGIQLYVVSGIQEKDVLVSVPLAVSTTSVAATQTGVLERTPDSYESQNLVTEAELAAALARLGTGRPASDTERELFIPARLSAGQLRTDFVETGELVLNVRDYGAKGDAATDDTTAIQAALTACPEGGTVFFPPGTYLISAPVQLRRNRTLQGSHAGLWPYDTGGPCRIRAAATFSGAALLLMQDEEAVTGSVGAPANGLYVGPNDQSGMAVYRLTLDGFNVAGSIDGILASGLIRSVRLSEVTIRRCSGSAVHTVGYARTSGTTVYPRGWRLDRVTAEACGNMGFATNSLNDSTFIDCLAVGNATHGFYLGGPGEVLLIGCRAPWNRGRGYYLTGTCYGNVVLSACSTDRNEQSGVFIDASGRHPILLSGCALRRDGRNNNGGGGNYAGLLVSGATTPVIVNGITTETGQDDDATGVMSPQYGMRVLNATAVVVDSGVLFGQQAAYFDGGGNGFVRIAPSVLRATGSVSNPTYTYGSALDAVAANLSGTVRALFAKTTSTTEHAATIYQAGTSGVDVASALNVVSDNPDSSAMYLSGTEKNRGTLKVAHRGYADGSDSGAAALSADVQTSGSAARGLYLWTSTGGVTGDPLAVRVATGATPTREDLVVKSTGRVGIGIAVAGTPSGMVDVRPYDDATPGVTVQGRATGTDLIQARRASDGAVRTRVSRDAQFVTQETAFFNGPALMISSTASTQVGGGTNCLGLGNASVVPTTNPTGGGVMYAEGGALKWRGSSGTVTTIAPA